MLFQNEILLTYDLVKYSTSHFLMNQQISGPQVQGSCQFRHFIILGFCISYSRVLGFTYFKHESGYDIFTV